EVAVRGGGGLRGAEEWWEGLKPDGLNEWRHSAWACERVFPFLRVVEYRAILLEGVLLGLTPHTNSGVFVDHALSLPTFPPTTPNTNTNTTDSYSLFELLRDLVAVGKKSFSSNRIYIPAIGAINTLLESGGMEEVEGDERGVEIAASQVKSAPRLTASLKTVTLLLGFPSVARMAASKVGIFLGHPSAWVRAINFGRLGTIFEVDFRIWIEQLRQLAAEELFASSPWTMQEDQENDELETLLSETRWSDDSPEVEKLGKKVVELLLRGGLENG
ncbi:hypothetical protein P7C70_g5789, partial [Phenoliferia sp. Uapishka_3]